MISNPIIDSMLNRKSIRHYTEAMPSEDVVETLVRAGQQAPFASQLGSLLLKRDQENNPFKAPLFFIVCVDSYKWERIMARRDWSMHGDDMLLMLLGMQDAALMAENMVIAAESLELGSCFLGGIPFHSEEIIKDFKLPPRVFPMVGLTIGYPSNDPPPRPRYPMEFVLFEDEYPQLDDELIQRSMDVMDEGYLAQDYYTKLKAMIPLEGDREETFDYDTYSWIEHICRKWGQELFPPNLLQQFERCGFDLVGKYKEEE
ncbi:MAG: nitroreductase family protein [Anaerolineales bacterium]|nr:nitroreductase family protein [Chloroflexota bacterium]MBL6983385.1 nitroreductase family protein [Anaerolineales bacterium]